MINLLIKPQEKIYVACSGGPDSMAALDFFRRGHKLRAALHIHHGTQASEAGLQVVRRYCGEHHIDLIERRLDGTIPAKKSLEAHWHDERYEIFHAIEDQVMTAHHIDDAIETWVFNSLHGNPRLIPPVNRNVIRPFLITPKADLVRWCINHDVPYIIDSSNEDDSFMRNYIRRNIIHHATHVNPGIRKVIRKMYLLQRGAKNGT